MKFAANLSTDRKETSLPVRGAWIEIVLDEKISGERSGRSPCGERGLKSACFRVIPSADRRSPCGERGLKSPNLICKHYISGSLPVRGAWIEIFALGLLASLHLSLPVRGAWIEMMN